MPHIAVEIRDLSYRYPRAKNETLKDLNFVIKEGEFIAVMGENGAGKTTFCQCLNGIIPHSRLGTMSGSVLINGSDTQTTTVAKLAEQVGMVLEDPETQIFTTKVKNEVAFALENLQLPVDEIQSRVGWALEAVGLQHFVERHPGALSGGQKQRLAIAAALAMHPRILVLDEPTSQLDPVAAVEVYKIIKELQKKHGLTIVIATHQAEEIAGFADRVCVLKSGKLAALGTPQQIFSDPQLMRENWLRPPQIVELIDYLAGRNMPLPDVPITKEQAKTAILSWIRKRGF